MNVDLKVIGAGFGRTGTDSMREALEILGVGPCHHMRSLLADDAHKDAWLTAVRTNNLDWNVLLGAHKSCIDWPSAQYWRELSRAFPQAKVLLTWRSADSWWDSMAKTIIPSIEKMIERGEDSPGRHILMQFVLAGQPISRENCIAAYEANVAAVKKEIPTHRLLVHKIGDGWVPLCDFLGVAVPDQAFPRSNATAEFSNWVEKSN